jgi:hypothetical protein
LVRRPCGILAIYAIAQRVECLHIACKRCIKPYSPICVVFPVEEWDHAFGGNQQIGVGNDFAVIQP